MAKKYKVMLESYSGTSYTREGPLRYEKTWHVITWCTEATLEKAVLRCAELLAGDPIGQWTKGCWIEVVEDAPTTCLETPQVK